MSVRVKDAERKAEIKASLKMTDLLLYYGLSAPNSSGKILCPFHQEDTPSCMINQEKNVWHCFGCKEGGDVFNFIALRENLHAVSDFTQILEKADIIRGKAPEMRPKNIRRTAATGRKLKERSGKSYPNPPVDVNNPPEMKGWGKPVVRYIYRRKSGAVHFVAARYERQARGADGKYKREKRMNTYEYCQADNSLLDKTPEAPFYPYPFANWKNIQNPKCKAVLIVEGEKTAKALAGLGFSFAITLCNALGYKKTNMDCVEGKHVYIAPDCDVAGVRSAFSVYEHLRPSSPQKIWVIYPPFGAEERGWDFADAVASGWSKDKITDFLMKNRIASVGEYKARFRNHYMNGGFTSYGVRERQDALRLLKSWDMAPAEEGRDVPSSEEGGALADFRVEKKEGMQDKPFRILGRLGQGKMVLQKLQTGELRQLNYTAFSQKSVLLSVYPVQSWWENSYLGSKELTKRACETIQSSINAEADGMDLYNSESVRKVGVWEDGGVLYFNRGNSCVVWDWRKKECVARLCGISSVAPSGMTMIEDKFAAAADLESPLQEADAKNVLGCIRRWLWEKEWMAELLCGFMFLVPVCGALPFRPHAWLTGETGVGKTELMNRIVLNLAKGFCYRISGSDTSQAGIRRLIGGRGVLMVKDEAEPKTKKGRETMLEIMEVIRDSTSGGKMGAVKVGQDMDLEVFSYHSMFLNASTQMMVMEEQNNNRMVKLCLRYDAQKREHWERVMEATERIMGDGFGRRWRGRSIRQYPVILENYGTLRSLIYERCKNSRRSDLMGMLLAGYFAAVSNVPVSREAADAWMTARDDMFGGSSELNPVWLSFLRTVFNCVLRDVQARHVSPERGDVVQLTPKPVWDLILISCAQKNVQEENVFQVSRREARHSLERHGIRLGAKLEGYGFGVVFAANHPSLNGLLSRTAFDGQDYFAQMAQYSGSVKMKRMWSFNGVKYPALFVELDARYFDLSDIVASPDGYVAAADGSSEFVVSQKGG